MIFFLALALVIFISMSAAFSWNDLFPKLTDEEKLEMWCRENGIDEETRNEVFGE
jgi:hypothetical protein